MRNLFKKLPAFAGALFLALIASAETPAQATIVILNGDAAGVGFNDTTPATPIGGNTGTTIGQQRLIAFQAAANIWGATLLSAPTITIRATWEPLACTATSGTLGSAGNNGTVYRNFSGAEPGFWYGIPLANALSGTDRNGPTHEINARFNVNLGTPGCLQNAHWYYGLDTNHGATGIDLVSVLLHEFAHGLGFQTFTNRTTGEQVGDDTNGRFPSIHDKYLFDNTAAKTWAQMTNAERVASAINDGNLVWSGPQVGYDATHGVLSLGTPRLRINSPGSIAGNYRIGLADFGPTLPPTGATADLVQALDPSDGSGPSTTDGCSALTNAAAISGKIALIDRGTCTFITKARNAQNAGAIAVIIVNNLADNRPPSLGGGPDNTITLSTVSVTQATGDAIKAQLSVGVNASVLRDMATFAGADAAGRPLLYAPNPIESGSSVSHWDDIALPNQLMEPSNSSDLDHSVAAPGDLTFSLLMDIGWKRSLAPTILVEPGTSQAAALDSVTQTSGPFSNISPNNLSGNGDTRRRIIFFTTDLALNPTDDLSVLKVFANGIQMVVESAGPNSRLAGTSFVIVRLDGLSQGTYALSVNLRGVNSTNAPTIQIIP